MIFGLFHIVTVVWTLLSSSGGGEGQAFLTALLDFPLVALLQAVPGGAKILYDSRGNYILFFCVVGTLMYAVAGFAIGALVRAVLGRLASATKKGYPVG